MQARPLTQSVARKCNTRSLAWMRIVRLDTIFGIGEDTDCDDIGASPPSGFAILHALEKLFAGSWLSREKMIFDVVLPTRSVAAGIEERLQVER
jgi:hypothetical protein